MKKAELLKLTQQQAADLAECKRLITEIYKIISKPYHREETAVRWDGPSMLCEPGHKPICNQSYIPTTIPYPNGISVPNVEIKS